MGSCFNWFGPRFNVGCHWFLHVQCATLHEGRCLINPDHVPSMNNIGVHKNLIYDTSFAVQLAFSVVSKLFTLANQTSDRPCRRALVFRKCYLRKQITNRQKFVVVSSLVERLNNTKSNGSQAVNVHKLLRIRYLLSVKILKYLPQTLTLTECDIISI